jgi:hypothetical protein
MKFRVHYWTLRRLWCRLDHFNRPILFGGGPTYECECGIRWPTPWAKTSEKETGEK